MHIRRCIDSHSVGASLRLIACLILAFVAAMGTAAPAIATEIVILKSADLSYYDESVQGFRAMLPPPAAVTEYSLGGDLSNGREIAKQLRASPPSLVFAVGLKAALAAKLELPDTPVVFTQVLDPTSHQLPTGHMAGIRVVVSPAQQLSTLHSLLPHARRIGLLYDADDRGHFLAEAEQHAHRLGVTVVPAPVRSSSDVPDALKSILPSIDALWVIQDRTVLTEASVPYVLTTSLKTKLPLFTFSDTMIRQGALGGLVVQPWELGKQAGALAVRVLHGEMKSLGLLLDPEHPQLVLNLHVAEYFGITPPTEILRAAASLYGPGVVAQSQGHHIR